jgi:predicted protein tyrosine phosphatase
MQPVDLEILITSRSEAEQILCSPTHCAEISYLVSIGDAQDIPPAGCENVQHMLRLHFADVNEEEYGPTEEDVRKIIGLAESLISVGGNVLVHCAAGISRSTAAALIMYTCWLGPGSECEAIERVISRRPIANPNRRMIALADKLLGREGRLIDAVNNERRLP